MEPATTNTRSEASPEEATTDLPAGAPEGLERAARGEKPDTSTKVGREQAARDEGEALDFLLGDPKPLEFDVPVTVDTANGRIEFEFRLRQLDGRTFIKIEDDNRKGSGPFAEVDEVGMDAALAGAAVVSILDLKTGRRVEVASREFVGSMVTPKDAFAHKFRFQPGVLTSLGAEIRRISGYGNDRIGKASAAGLPNDMEQAAGS